MPLIIRKKTEPWENQKKEIKLNGIYTWKNGLTTFGTIVNGENPRKSEEKIHQATLVASGGDKYHFQALIKVKGDKKQVNFHFEINK